MTVYEYTTFRIERGGWNQLREDVFGRTQETTRDVGGAIFLLCAGMIGFASDEGVLIRACPDEKRLTTIETDVFRDMRQQRLQPTVRPADPEPQHLPGVYAHRWFWLDDANWEEFLRLSHENIWPFFESDGCNVVGLWRGQSAGKLTRALLITRYNDVAHWERTRLQSPEPPPGTDADLYRCAQEGGRQRAVITERSIVRLTRIVLPCERN
jgi:hypothetical protein